MSRTSVAVICSFLVVACSGCSESSAPGPQAQRILGDARYGWVTLETGHIRIHFPAGSYAETVAGTLPGRAERARAEVLQRLSVPDHTGLVHLFYVDGREDMANLTGSPVTGFSYFGEDAAVVVFNEDWRAFEEHELTHTITLGSWGPAAGPAVVEGLATYVDGACGGYEIGRITSSFLERGALIALVDLVADFRGQDDLIAYLQAGTLIEFVVETRGPEVLDSLWDQGLLAAPPLLGMSRAEFGEAFEGWVRSEYSPIPDSAVDAIRKRGCGISVPGADR